MRTAVLLGVAHVVGVECADAGTGLLGDEVRRRDGGGGGVGSAGGVANVATARAEGLALLAFLGAFDIFHVELATSGSPGTARPEFNRMKS